MHERGGALKAPPFSPATAARQRAQQRELACCQCGIAQRCDAVAGVAGQSASGVAAEGRQLLRCGVGLRSDDATGRAGTCQVHRMAALHGAHSRRRPGAIHDRLIMLTSFTTYRASTSRWRGAICTLDAFAIQSARALAQSQFGCCQFHRCDTRHLRWKSASSRDFIPPPTTHAPNRRYVAAGRRLRARQTE